MARPTRHHLPHFFSHHPTAQFEELLASVSILEFALAAVVLFEPIYLYTLGFSLVKIMGFYAVVYGAYVFLVPLGGKFLGRFGYERTILVASLVYICYYLALFSIPANSAFLWIAAVLFAIQKSFYWPAFHLDFVRNAQRGEVGREFSAVWSVVQLVAIIGPIAGGAMVAFFGFQTLFIVVSVLILTSNIPLFFTREVNKREKLDYGSTFSLLTDRVHGRRAIAYLGFGEELIWMTLWPIFIFLIVQNTVEVGSIVAFASLAAVVTTLVAGRLTDTRHHPKTILSLTSVILSALWVLRAFLFAPLQLFLGDALGRVFKNASFVPLVAMTYERAQKDGALRMVVSFEQVLAIGKTLTALLLMVLMPFVSPFVTAFILAGFLSLLYLTL